MGPTEPLGPLIPGHPSSQPPRAHRHNDGVVMPDSQADDFLDPSLDSNEREQLLETAHVLAQNRPVPRPGFRGRLARQLGARSAGPHRLRLLIGAYAGSGTALLLLVALGLAGVGPVAA